jgi:predicted GNAT superfamily acetyltransferase
MAHAVSSSPSSAWAQTAVSIREVRGADELRACQELQRRAWGITEDGYVVPVATMAGAQRVGGLILGAFDANTNHLVGFAFGFLGQLQKRLILYSQLTGVHPAHQSTGVGRMLKFEQHRRARDRGLEAVVWAFDPLQASNAAFNLSVLGATSRSYEVDMYGSRSDALNAGLATDRLLAEWPTSQQDPAGRAEPWADGVDLIDTAPARSRNVHTVQDVRKIPPGAFHLNLEVPSSIADVKTYGPPGAAQQWQLAVRETFLAAFAAGFVAVGFTRADRDHPRYLLERTS